MTEDHNIVQDVRKAWVSPVVIEASADLNTQAANTAGSDLGIS